MELDTTQALKDAENSLRDFISSALRKTHGDEWIEKLGVSPERIERWKERKEIESKRQESGTVEERLLYYADFYDLKTILWKHWSTEFSQVFGERKTMEVWLTELEKLRDPDAHRRELLPHQKHLVLGISGEIRSLIVRYRSTQDTAEGYFPKIESVRDNYGNIWVPGEKEPVSCKTILHVNDLLELVVTASDPYGESIEYSYLVAGTTSSVPWQASNVFSININEGHIGVQVGHTVYVRSKRQFHAHDTFDDVVMFKYTTLPPRL